ncbi:glycosyltransferase family 4 protein [Legionella sp. W05-934-2]|uniref:glycosyltransferase family 4 protein n=1 Tax=Legionella sp. W05-934-2 TaxID=1198649 RepID=UPI00346260D3
MPNSQPKTIWYCHHYAGSPTLGMSYRPYYLTREFCQQGHNAYVVNAAYHHLLLNPKKQKEKVVKQTIDDVPFISLKTRPYQGNGLSRILNMLDYARVIKKQQKKIIALTGKPDVIIVSSAHPFHFPILKKLAKKYNAKLIFEVRDLWPLSLQLLLHTSALHPLIIYLAYLEKQAYQQADSVVSVLQNSMSYMQSRGLSQDKFRYIPNGIWLDELKKSENLPNLHWKAIENLHSKLFKLGYAGALGEPNAMNYLIDAMHLLQEKKVLVHLFIVGDGHLKEKLIQQSERLGLNNITFLPRISKRAIPTFLNQMDALYLGWQPSEIYQYGVSPNKLFDYMASGKPIIESGGDQNGIIRTSGCGVQCEAVNPVQISECIEEVMSMPKSKLEEMGKIGMQAVQAYDYGNLAKQYLQNFSTDEVV